MVYTIVENRLSGHFLHLGTQVTIERPMSPTTVLVRSTYGSKQATAVVSTLEIERVCWNCGGKREIIVRGTRQPYRDKCPVCSGTGSIASVGGAR